MNFLDKFVVDTQKDVVQKVQELIAEKKIKEKTLDETQQYAQKIANHKHDPSEPEPEKFTGIEFGDNLSNQLEYALVLDYLESIGLKFAPTVFRYESQHPNVFSERNQVANELKLRSYDRTPLLVQMIEETRKTVAREQE